MPTCDEPDVDEAFCAGAGAILPDGRGLDAANEDVIGRGRAHTTMRQALVRAAEAGQASALAEGGDNAGA